MEAEKSPSLQRMGVAALGVRESIDVQDSVYTRVYYLALSMLLGAPCLIFRGGSMLFVDLF